MWKNANASRVVRRVLVAGAAVAGVLGAAGAASADTDPVPEPGHPVIMSDEQAEATGIVGPAASFAKPVWYLPGVYYFGSHEPLPVRGEAPLTDAG